MALFTALTHLSVTTGLIILITTFLVLLRLFKSNSTGKNFNGERGVPLPGPRGIPVFGSMFAINRTEPYKSMMTLAQHYGNIFQIKLGNRKVLVLNGLDAIQQALVKQPNTFAGRPDLLFFKLMNLTGAFGPCFSFSTYSEQWSLHRRLAEKSLKHFTGYDKIDFLESIAGKEAKTLVDYIVDNSNKGILTTNPSISGEKNPCNIRGIVRLSVSNVMGWYLFGKRRSYNNEQLIEVMCLMERFNEAFGNGNPLDFLPWLRPFYKSTVNRFVKFRNQYSYHIKDMVMKQYNTYELGSEHNIIDYLITASRSNREEFQQKGLTENDLLQTADDFFGAGFEPVSTTLEWCILYMAKYPDIQLEIQRELDTIVGRDRLPCLNDRDNLPLTQSCILEIQRHLTVVPFTIPHSTTKDTILDGYYVPKDMVVFINLYSAHHDPNLWTEPDVFNARRFLSSNGTLDKEKANLIIPFGLGRRRCVGSDLAKINLFLFFSTLLHQVSFSPPDGETVSLEAMCGLVKWPKDYAIKVELR